MTQAHTLTDTIKWAQYKTNLSVSWKFCSVYKRCKMLQTFLWNMVYLERIIAGNREDGSIGEASHHLRFLAFCGEPL